MCIKIDYDSNFGLGKSVIEGQPTIRQMKEDKVEEKRKREVRPPAPDQYTVEEPSIPTFDM